ncbi:MAG TPA: ABC transporter ATP-binding protein [Spirochaetia bacterium]
MSGQEASEIKRDPSGHPAMRGSGDLCPPDGSHSSGRGGALLSVRNLRTVIDTAHGTFPVVDDVSFDLGDGKVLGIVGESGSGKTLLSMSILGLLPKRARIDAGDVLLGGRNLRGLSERELRGMRGKRIGMVFQEPQTSFDPLYTIGEQIAESVRRHSSLGRQRVRARTVELLDTVGIPRPDLVYDEYPFQLSGGMRQRAMIAMALAPGPQLLIADEPTTALDVTIQAQILALLGNLQRETGISVLFISHHLGVIAEIADEVMVMYGGQVMERTSVDRLFDEPAHPYTRSLLAARPTLDGAPSRLRAIPGQVPSLESRPPGCPFHPRCDKAMEICARERPIPRRVGGSEQVACWLYGEGREPYREGSVASDAGGGT